MTLYEGPGVLRAICDDLMNRVQNGHHCVSLQILRRVLLPTWQITNQVPQSVAPCNDELALLLVWVCRCTATCMHVRVVTY